jgi:catechol 2,3-dioxygenase-like lactoylglutathione lyase family enzyme
MTHPGLHPDSGTPFQPVARASDPAIRVHDLALIEFEGPDSAKAWSFFTGFGLHGTREDDGTLLFSAEAGAPVAVIYRPAQRAEFLGPTFAVLDPAGLEILAQRTGAEAPAPLTLPGQPLGVVLTDPNGVTVKVACFEDWRELPCCGEAPAVNRGDSRPRVNRTRRPERCPSRVLRLGHMVLGTPQWEATARFYIDTFGLIPSDVQALSDGRPAIAFLRCDRGDAPADHHTFVVGRLPVVDFEHAAFEVPDLDEVGMGGEVLRNGGFRRAWGIGRHILGSQIFDYWYGPDGRKFEHFTDGDLFDAKHATQYHAMSMAGLAQWGPPLPSAFIRPRMGWREFRQLLRNLFGRSGFGFRELKLMSAAMRSKTIPESPAEHQA